jgi:CubicO group peptidase (beta-lactamase class C family)
MMIGCNKACSGRPSSKRERPMTADAIFRIVSMTKPVTSVAAMQLYERGLFACDDPAEKGPMWE